MNGIQEIKNSLKKEFEETFPIIQSLSKYGKIVIRNYKPLQLNEKDNDILFHAIKNEVDYIRKTIELNEGKDVLGVFISFAFKALFLNDNSFKYDNLDKKIDIFDIILQYHKTLVTDNNIKKYEEVLYKNIGNKEFKFFKDYIKSDILYFIHLVLRSFQASQLILNEYIIRLVEIYSVSVIHFRYEELENIPHNEIINKIYDLLFQKQICNNFHLFIEEGHLKIIEFTNDELLNYINRNNSIRIKGTKGKKANRKKNKKKIVNSPKNEEKQEEKNNKFVLKQEIMFNIDSDINKRDVMNLSDKQFRMLMIEKLEIIEKKINDMEKTNEEKVINLNHLKERDDEIDKKIKELNEQIYCLNKKQITQDLEIFRIKSYLNLIEVPLFFKCFIDYLYYYLHLSDDITYEKKIEAIIKTLNEFNGGKYNRTLIESTIGLLNKLSGIIKTRNYKNYHLDLNASVID